jgi:TRAP-type C4-dicarboxylate transport system substrate-binding protein
MRKVRNYVFVLSALAADDKRASAFRDAISAICQQFTADPAFHVVSETFCHVDGARHQREIKGQVFDAGSVVSNQQDAYSQVKTGTVDLTLSIVVKDDVPGLQIATFPYAFPQLHRLAQVHERAGYAETQG